MRSPVCTDPKKEAFWKVRVHAGNMHVDFDVDRQPLAYSQRENLLINVVNQTVKKSFVKKKKSETSSYLSLI